MNIRPKIILVVLPFIVVPLAMATMVAYLSAKDGITAIASDLLRFKSQTLGKYADGQLELLLTNDLDDDPEYIEAAQKAVGVFARSLLRSPSELIFAVDGTGSVVMSTDSQSLADGATPQLRHSDIPIGGLWSDTLALEEMRRVAYIDSYIAWEWTFYVTEAWEAFFSPVSRIAFLIGLIGSISLIVSLVFLIIATGLISRPLEGMVKVIKNIIDTMDLKSRVPILYKDETGRLAHSFNRMTTSLEKANKDVKDFALRAVFAHRRAVLAQKEAEASHEREQSLRVLFQKYVPQSIIDQNIDRKGKNLLVGENRHVSILMSDIRSFTTLSEKMPPSELVDSLNRYFELMVDEIDKNGGITDKYIGDAIMALFGAPEKQHDDIWRSVQAGIGMLSALEKFNEGQTRRGKKTFQIGIGIHYGEVTAGNIGSDKKLEYTVIGETVNMASRLEGLTKYYGASLVVSEAVKKSIEKKVKSRLLDKVFVKGSNLPIQIYTVAEKLTAKEKELWEAFAHGQREYYKRNFTAAQTVFQDALKASPDDLPCQHFLERTKKFIKTPPEKDWNGAFRHESK